jgi:hypothetical protein
MVQQHSASGITNRGWSPTIHEPGALYQWQSEPRSPDIASPIVSKQLRVAFGYKRFRCLKSSRSSALKLCYGFSGGAARRTPLVSVGHTEQDISHR